MPNKYFGTDGVRGLANGELTPELALEVASAAARVLIALASEVLSWLFSVLTGYVGWPTAT